MYLTDAVADALEESEIDYMTDRMKAIRHIEGNPEGIHLARFGNARLYYSETMPWPQFNTVKGLRVEDIQYVDDMITFFRARNRTCQFEIVPKHAHPLLFKKLSESGCYQSGFHATLYGAPERQTACDPEPAEEIRVLPCPEEEMLTYAAIHCRGTGLGDDGIPYVARNNEVLLKRPGWSFFIAYQEDKAAAAGVMYRQNGIASLTFAATLPSYRNIGMHAALLRRRIHEAALSGCRVVVSQASYLSQSHRNMERAGMKLGYVRATWTLPV
ncbi:GNAT family N-acetyltransferase [Paenibacillus apiarius]|uniref:GNAT family N-acetyltransferase n=1 Tax=Paenibacillus apiarius TaxID=46240 RepID=UPI00197E4BA7|nr:GNAT family N-acetyltransferase [Paenibacillus apiarius]